MKKFVSLLLASLLLLTMLPAFAEEEPLKVGFSVVTQEFPFHVKLLNGIQDGCAEHGYELVYADANRNADKQLSDCEDLLAQDVDVLIIATYYGDALVGILEDCKADGIPVIMLSSSGVPSDESLYLTNIGVDNYTAGYYGGVYAAEYIKEHKGKKNVDLCMFKAATQVGLDRVNGFQAGLEESGLTVNLLNIFDGSTREDFMASCEDALTAYPNIDLIYGYSAQSGLGCYDAVVAAKRDEVYIVGTDAEDEEIAFIDAGTQYIGSVMQFPYDMAKFTVDCVAKHEAGEELESYYAYATGVYTVNGETVYEKDE